MKSPRSAVLAAVLSISVLGGLPAQDLVTCEFLASEELPPLAEGRSELVFHPGFSCSGGTPGQQVSIEIVLFISAPVVNPVIDKTGGTDALLIVNPRDFSQTGLTAGDVFFFQRDPNLQNGLVGGATFTVPPAGQTTILQPVNIRVDTTQSREPGTLFSGAFIDGLNFLPDVPIALLAGEPPADFEFFADPEFQVVIEDIFPGSIRPRTAFGNGAQLDLTDPFGTSQSQFIPPDGTGSGDQRFAADAGNRFLITVTGLPDGVMAMAPPIIRPDLLGRDLAQAPALRSVVGADERGLGGVPSPWGADGDPLRDRLFVALTNGQVAVYEAGWPNDTRPDDAPTDVLNRYRVDVRWSCPDTDLEPAEASLSIQHAPIALPGAPVGLEGAEGGGVPLPGPAYDPNIGPAENITFDPADCAPMGEQPPVVSEGGVVNGAGFTPGVAPGEIVTVFGTGLGPAEPSQAEEVPLADELDGTTAELEGIPAPPFFVSEPQINIQVPFDVPAPPPGGQLNEEGVPGQRATATLIIRRDGLESAPVELEILAAAPGVFTVTGGPGQAIAINPDGTLAQPAGSIPGLVTRPVVVGDPLIVLATGLGQTIPPGVTGANSFDENGEFVRRDTAIVPTVTIGGVAADVAFSGLSPEFVGVNQLNVIPGAGTPTGDAVPLVIDSAGAASRDDVTIAVTGP